MSSNSSSKARHHVLEQNGLVIQSIGEDVRIDRRALIERRQRRGLVDESFDDDVEQRTP
jgi:hypothetical protein